jgi:hypothetical protein
VRGRGDRIECTGYTEYRRRTQTAKTKTEAWMAALVFLSASEIRMLKKPSERNLVVRENEVSYFEFENHGH